MGQPVSETRRDATRVGRGRRGARAGLAVILAGLIAVLPAATATEVAAGTISLSHLTGEKTVPRARTSVTTRWKEWRDSWRPEQRFKKVINDLKPWDPVPVALRVKESRWFGLLRSRNWVIFKEESRKTSGHILVTILHKGGGGDRDLIVEHRDFSPEQVGEISNKISKVLAREFSFFGKVSEIENQKDRFAKVIEALKENDEVAVEATLPRQAKDDHFRRWMRMLFKKHTDQGDKDDHFGWVWILSKKHTGHDDVVRIFDMNDYPEDEPKDLRVEEVPGALAERFLVSSEVRVHPRPRPGKDSSPPAGEETPARLTTQRYFHLTKVVDDYFYELAPPGVNDPTPSSVYHLNPEEQEKRRVYFSSDGLLRRAQDNKVFDSAQANFNFPAGWGWAIFLMDRYGNLYASNEKERGKFHHSTLLHAEKVAGGGQFKVSGGRIERITPYSGHYKFDRESMKQVYKELVLHHVRRVPIYDHLDQELWDTTPDRGATQSELRPAA